MPWSAEAERTTPLSFKHQSCCATATRTLCDHSCLHPHEPQKNFSSRTSLKITLRQRGQVIEKTASVNSSPTPPSTSTSPAYSPASRASPSTAGRSQSTLHSSSSGDQFLATPQRRHRQSSRSPSAKGSQAWPNNIHKVTRLTSRTINIPPVASPISIPFASSSVHTNRVDPTERRAEGTAHILPNTGGLCICHPGSYSLPHTHNDGSLGHLATEKVRSSASQVLPRYRTQGCETSTAVLLDSRRSMNATSVQYGWLRQWE